MDDEPLPVGIGQHKRSNAHKNFRVNASIAARFPDSFAGSIANATGDKAARTATAIAMQLLLIDRVSRDT
jgi:hypothetical protein